MAAADWRRNPDGKIALFPVTGWDAAVLSGKAVGLRLHLIQSEADMAVGAVTYAPLILTPAQAREMATALTRAAERAEASPPPSPAATS